jgi:hypothetical protein
MNYDHLSPLAQKLGAWMATQCEDGLPGHFGDDLLEAFPDSDKKHLSVALAELKADGLVELSEAPRVSRRLLLVRRGHHEQDNEQVFA